MANLSDLSLEQLQQRLAELETEWHEVEAAIASKHEEGKKQLAEEIKQKIEDAGQDVVEIVGLIASRRRRGKVAITRAYTTYVDPDNSDNTYVRGVLPGWLKDKMKDAGFDPGNRKDRETFKAEYLKKVTA